MTYEHDIPEYAMLPAREPKERVIVPAGKGTVYSQVQVTNIKEKPKTTIIIEEDILVPYTKPDLRQILMIDGSASLSSRELSPMQRKDDYISISGEIELQTLLLSAGKSRACRSGHCGADTGGISGTVAYGGRTGLNNLHGLPSLKKLSIWSSMSASTESRQFLL